MRAPSVLIARTRTGRIVEEVTGVTGSVSDDLGGGNITGSFSFPVRAGLRPLLDPWRHMVVVATDDHVWWAGPITSKPHRPRGGRVDVTCGSVWSLLAHLPAWTTDARPPDPACDLTLTMRSPRGLGVGVLANALTYGPLPLVLPPGPFPGWNTWSWPSHELTDAASALRDLLDEETGTGVEVHFRPRWVGGLAGASVEWEARVGDPQLLDPGTVHTWDTAGAGVVGLAETDSDVEPVTTAWVGGAGQDVARIVGTASSPVLLGAGYPALHSIDTTTTAQVEDVRTADARARGRVNARERPSLVPVVAADGAPNEAGVPVAPVFGQWNLGDPCRFEVRDDGWIMDGSYVGRFGKWAYMLGSNEVAVALTGGAS